MTAKTTSTASARCPEGWRLFWRLGELYEIEIRKPLYKRDWKDHQEAIDLHKEHIQGCENCHFGIKSVQIELEERAVENAP